MECIFSGRNGVRRLLVEHVFMNAGDIIERTIMELIWPEELALFGEMVTFWGVIIDDDTGEIVSPLAQMEFIY